MIGQIPGRRLGQVYLHVESLSIKKMTHENVLLSCLTPTPSAPPLHLEPVSGWEEASPKQRRL